MSDAINTGNQYDIQWSKVKADLQAKKVKNGDNSDVSFKEVMQEIDKTPSKSLPVDTSKAYAPVDSEYYLSYIKRNKDQYVVKYGAYFNHKEEVERYAVNIPEEPAMMKYAAHFKEPPALVKYGANFGEIIRPLYAVNVEDVKPERLTPQSNSPLINTKTGVSVGNYTVPKGMGYEKMLKLALKEQGLEQTTANIKIAKEQFKAANKPGTVHVYNGVNSKLQGTEYLWANDKVVIPQFNISK